MGTEEEAGTACAREDTDDPGGSGAHATGEWEFEGVASSGRLDRQREKMTAAALEAAAGESEIELVLAHHGTGDVVGVVRKRWVEQGKLRVRGALRGDDPAAQELRRRMERGERFGLSLGGKVTKAHWGYDRETEGPVRHLDEVKVEHVAVCRPEAAVNSEAWVGRRSMKYEG